MSGGRFLIGLREMELSELVLLTSWLKESADIFGEDLRKGNMDESLLVLVDDELNALSSDFESCLLNEEGIEVAAIIAGYISKVIFYGSLRSSSVLKSSYLKIVIKILEKCL